MKRDHGFILKYRSLVVILISLFLSLLILIFFLSKNAINIDAQNLGLGQQTSSYYPAINDLKIHCNDTNINECISFYEDKKKLATLWLGNSQLHGINQMKAGDVTASELLYRMLTPHEMNLVTISMGNASLLEKYELLKVLANKININQVIIPLIMDDMRESGVRSSIKNYAKENSLIDELAEITKEDYIDDGSDDLNRTYQEKSENFLNSKLEMLLPAWKTRGEMRTKIFFDLYYLRNKIFKISASSKRSMLPGVYRQNIDALENILKLMSKNDIEVFLYIAPIRNDVDIPYIASEYMSFKNELISLSNKYHTDLYNFEDIVDSLSWGYKNSTGADGSYEIDFMHFQASGHKALADSLYFKLILDKVQHDL
tara:strand:- start:62 stop:1177 length:1116 start_codon:yes stop_codon:yes gene_type:complete